MHYRAGAIVLSSLLLLLSLAGDALAYRRGRGHYGYSWGAARQFAIGSIKAQVAQFDAIARQADATAAAASVSVSAANARISAAREAIESSEKEARQASKEMAAAEEQMLDAAGHDSAIVKAKEKYEQARAEVQKQEHRVLHSPEYLAALEKTEGTDEHERVVPKLRADALASDELYQHAKEMVELAKNQYMDLRNVAVTHDSHWLEASEEKKNSLMAEAAALNEGTKGGLQKLPAAETMHHAQRVAAQARAYAMSGRAVLASMGASAPPPKTPPAPLPSAN